MITVRNTIDYPVAADDLWEATMAYSALDRVMQGKVAFRGLPEGRPFQGQVIDLQVSLFGILPWQAYRIEMVEFSETQRLMRSSEGGAGVTAWRHTSRVVDTGSGSQIVDKIEIEAGWRTPFVALFAKWMYRARHKPRVALLREKGLFP